MLITARVLLVLGSLLAVTGEVRAETVLVAGKGSTLTKAAWSFRVVRGASRQPCKVLQQADCTQTQVRIVNESDAELACAGQLYVPPGPGQEPYIENFGSLVAPRATENAFEFENTSEDPVDPARSFVICNTTAERDEADTGDTGFARRPPSACKFTLKSTPQLDDYYATAARAANQQGLVRIRVVFMSKSGAPVPLGVTQSSGALRVDRGALLAASRMVFETNCPGTFSELPIRFQLTN